MSPAILIVVRREHRLWYYKKKEDPKLCVTVVKHSRDPVACEV